MIDVTHSILLITITAVITFGLRAVPFLLFGGSKAMPPIIKTIANKLPPAIMAVLVIYCLKSDITAIGSGTAVSAIAVITVVGVHLWKRNTLLSVFAGTGIYMLCLRLLPILL